MKLRNKKTGEIIEIDSIHFVFNDGYAPFSSLRILNTYWEDYTPAEPLIKDEKIRKAVRFKSEALVGAIEQSVREFIDDIAELCGEEEE